MRLWYVSWDEYWSGRKKEEKQYWDLIEQMGLNEMEEQWDINLNSKELNPIEDRIKRKATSSKFSKMEK